MPDPYLAHSLVNLRAEVDHRWPNRDRSSDGWIGDAAHQHEVSEHNPDAKGCVHALDIDSSNIDVAAVVAAAIKHPATWYVISNRFIYSRTHGFAKTAYTGDPHTSHVHTSILLTTAAENSNAAWLSAPVTPRSVLRVGATGLAVKMVQKAVGVAQDGVFGPRTLAAVKVFQSRHHLTPDGVVGPLTWRAILG